MKRATFGLALLGALTIISGCEGGGPSDEVKPPQDSNSDKNEHPKYSVPDEFRQSVSGILSSYFEVHSALAQDDFQKAKDTLTNVAGSAAKAEKLDAANLEESIREAWIKNIQDVRLVANKASDAEDMKKARQCFADLSEKLIATIRDFGHVEKDAVQLLKCGMAFNGKGAYWLQRNKNESVKNPYFGSEMLECGQKVSLLNGTPTENHRYQSESSSERENIIERVVDGVTYEIILDCQPRSYDVAGFPLPYFYVTGCYREKTDDNAAPWQEFLLYFKGANTKYESIEIVLQDWRISDGITQWPNHDPPDGVPDSIECVGDSTIRLCIYHQYVGPYSQWYLRDINNDGVAEWFEDPQLPFRPDEHKPWLAIPEIRPEHLSRAVALAQKKLRLVTELINVKELKQCISKIECERIEQILR